MYIAVEEPERDQVSHMRRDEMYLHLWIPN